MRILITGIGIVSPFGLGREVTLRGMLTRTTAIAELTLIELPGVRVATAGQVPDLPAGPGSRADRMAVLAAREALGDLPRPRRAGAALFVGGTTAGLFEAEQTLAALTADPTRTDFDRGCIPGHALTSPGDRVHEQLGPFASSATVCSACSGGAAAIALAAAALRGGRVPRALAGGVDALSRMSLAGFAALSALDPAPCRPFDVSRAGLSLGEGAAFLLLETEDAARERGATPIAELAGWAIAAEAHHLAQPALDGAIAARTMRRAAQRASLAAGEVGWVNAHGTATPANDAMEAAAIAGAFGAVPVSSLKGHIGHALGAAGAIESAVTAWCLGEGVIAPTAGLTAVDPACAQVDHVREARRGPLRAALSSSFGFGGTDVVLAFRQVGSGPRPGEPEARALVITAACTFGPRGWGVDPAVYLDPQGGDDVLDVPLPPHGGAPLDPVKSRRFDPASRLVTAVAREVLAHGPSGDRVGIVVGSAFGSVQATGRFLRQIAEKGARFASPAAFPTVLPSALAANPSIYLGLHGPALSCADLGTSAEAALALAALLLEDDQAAAMVIAAVEEQSAVASAVSSPLISGLGGRPRGEGASALLLEVEAAARARGARVLAVLSGVWSFRGALPALPAPRGARPATIAARREVPSPPGWPPVRWVRGAGDHESVGGVALAAAVSAIASGVIDEALVVGVAPDRGHAFLLSAPLLSARAG